MKLLDPVVLGSPVEALDPVPLSTINSLDPVPIKIKVTEDGTVWWGGNGVPSTTPPGAKVGDYWVDYLTGDVYKLTADFFG